VRALKDHSMEAFTHTVETWHDFYVMMGTTSATLMGLLFVSLSINVDTITRKENDDLRVLATQTFASFLTVLLFAVLFLIPRQTPRGLALPLFGIGGFGLFITIRRFFRARQSQQRRWGRKYLTSRFRLPIVCYASSLPIAVLILMSSTSALYWLVPVMILLIMDASLNAWHLLLRLRDPGGEGRGKG